MDASAGWGECSDAAGLATAQALAPVATDNCDQTLVITKVPGAFIPAACGGTYTNTWTATDDCGNVSVVFTQVITIVDTEAPGSNWIETYIHSDDRAQVLAAIEEALG